MDEPHLIKRLRKHAQDHLEKIEWKTDSEFFQKRTYLQTAFLSKNYALEGYEKNILVFENGNPRLDLSTLEALPKTVILPFCKACRSYKPILDSFHESFLKREKDPLFFLHLATFQEGIFLYIPPHSLPQGKLQVLYLSSSSQEPVWTVPRLHIVLGTKNSLNILETTIHEGASPLHSNRLTSFDIAQEASLTHAHTTITPHKNYSNVHVRASLKKDAFFASTSILTQHQTMSQRVQLQEPQSRCDLQGAWIAHPDAFPKTAIHVEHVAENTHSTQLFKGVVFDHAESSFSGLITIHKGANGSNARQLNQNILLGEHTKAYSKPQLEIFADDVQATHGATTGKLDEQMLFYMQTRGIPVELAKTLLLQSFIKEITKELPHYDVTCR